MKRLTSFLLAMVIVFGALFLVSCGKKSVAKTEYDENGRRIRSVWYDSIGQVTGYTTYEYGENAKLAKLKNFNPEGVLLTYTLLEYDDAGNEIKKERFDSEGVLLTRSAYEYDENGNIKNTKFTMPAE